MARRHLTLVTMCSVLSTAVSPAIPVIAAEDSGAIDRWARAARAAAPSTPLPRWTCFRPRICAKPALSAGSPATGGPSTFPGNSGTSDHIRAGQLRGMSPDQMLVLVNGKRRHTSAVVNTETKIGRGTAAVDFNTIPMEAVSRIEVLRDGAGAQYGSDAIAGVVNVILDD